MFPRLLINGLIFYHHFIVCFRLKTGVHFKLLNYLGFCALVGF